MSYLFVNSATALLCARQAWHCTQTTAMRGPRLLMDPVLMLSLVTAERAPFLIWATLFGVQELHFDFVFFLVCNRRQDRRPGWVQGAHRRLSPRLFHVFHLSWLYVIWICMPLWTAAGCEVSCFGELVPCCVGSFVLSFCCFASTLDRDDSDLLCQGGVAGLHYR